MIRIPVRYEQPWVMHIRVCIPVVSRFNLVSYDTVTFAFQLQKLGRDVRTGKNFKLFFVFLWNSLEPGRVLDDPPE